MERKRKRASHSSYYATHELHLVVNVSREYEAELVYNYYFRNEMIEDSEVH